MKFFPIFMNIQDQPCLVVGGGQVAARKVFLLKRAGAQITIISPKLCHELQGLVDNMAIDYVKAEFSAKYITNQKIIIAATDNEAVNKEVSEAAKAKGIPVNVVDAPELCSFIPPSMIFELPKPD